MSEATIIASVQVISFSVLFAAIIGLYQQNQKLALTLGELKGKVEMLCRSQSKPSEES
jgi:hypothetical protein